MNETHTLVEIGRILEGEARTQDILRALWLVDQALENDPEAVALWCLKGDLLLLIAYEDSGEVEEAERCYRRVIQLDPRGWDGYESLGWFQEFVREDAEMAEAYYLEALDYGGGPDSFLGLARIHSARGELGQARALLQSCPYNDDVEVQELLVTLEDEALRTSA
jgi:tetratricopeptide (TPR) repeat protein